MEFFNILFGNFETNLLIFARALGIIAFNPILSRRNIPRTVKIGLAMMITLVSVMVMSPENVDTGTITGVYLLTVAKEAFVGLVLGFITDMFIYSVQMGGEIMDMQSGLGMAKVFDPISNTQSSVMGSVVGFMIYLYFFSINAHLSIVRLFVTSYDIVPIGNWSINTGIGMAMMEYFVLVLALVLKFALPITVAEIIVQFGLGIMMKSVPQIQIMMVNIQLKVMLGFWILFIISAPIANFIDKYMNIWLKTLEEAIPLIPA